jgi:hypothetical protein
MVSIQTKDIDYRRREWLRLLLLSVLLRASPLVFVLVLLLEMGSALREKG